MKLLDTTGRLFSKEDANKIAKTLNDQDDLWGYAAKHDPKKTGYSFVEITDENGEFVGIW